MIRHIYFDVGGVVIKDYSGNNKWEEMKSALNLVDHHSELFDQVWKEYDELYNFCIDYDVDNLIPVLEERLQRRFPENYSLLMDFVERFDSNPSIIPVLKKAKQKYKIGLLTNMFPRMFPAIQKKGIIPAIEWDVIIDSSQVGYQKPDKKMYQLAEKLSSAKKEEILFVDNLVGNIEAARELGWQTFLYDASHPEESSKTLESVIEKL